MTRPVRGWLYLTPMLVALIAWVYLPLIATGALSFAEWDLTSGPPEFVGVGNYTALFNRPELGASLQQTMFYVAGMMIFAIPIPLGLAVLLWKRPGRASAIYRTLLFLPVILAPVATAVSWQFLLNPLQGLVNAGLEVVGAAPVNWLGDPSTALATIVVITGAKIVGLNMLLYGAALAGLDRRCVQAARLDGATEWESTRHIVLPQLKRTTGFLALLCVVLAGQWTFTNISVLTQGGPAGATDNIFYLLYTYGFSYFDTGLAAATAMLLLLGLGALAGLRAAVAARQAHG